MASTSRSTDIIEEEEVNHHNDDTSRVDNLFQLVKVELDFLEKSFQETKCTADRLIVQINEVRSKSEELRRRQRGLEIETELQELKKTVSKLKSKIPFNLITPDDVPNPNVKRRPRIKPNQKPRKPLVVDNGLLMDNDHHPTYEDMLLSLRDLDYSPETLLQSFLVFPEGAFIKKCLLISFLRAAISKTYAIDFNQTIDELLSKGFIKSVYKKCSRTVSGFWMHPFVHSTLKKCLPTWEGGPYFSLISMDDDADEDMIYDEPGEYSTMKDLQFLHLGNWKRSTAHHIEMEDPQLYFENTTDIEMLQYISFRGISMMTELPNFISNLKRLECLDLKACHNFEAIPSDIGNLQRCLIHLDMSECYFLDHMPASLSRLTRLRVLKGFFVGDTNNEESCTLQDLSSLTCLLKLNIYTSVRTFPSEDQFATLQEFKCLQKLTISWGGCSTKGERRESRLTKSPTFRPRKFSLHGPDPVVMVNEFPSKLKKLDLQCVPEKVTGNWLRATNFKHLERLYIRGGKFSDLGYFKDDQWSVEILRLKYLSKLQMDWNELRKFFPKLVSVEQVDCPNLTSYPCDECGLWTGTTPTPATTFF